MPSAPSALSPRLAAVSWMYAGLAVAFFGAFVGRVSAPQSVAPQGVRLALEMELEQTPTWRGGRAMHTSGRLISFSTASSSATVSGERLLVAFDTVYRFSPGDRVRFIGYVNPIDSVSSSYGRLMRARGFTGRTYIGRYSFPLLDRGVELPAASEDIPVASEDIPAASADISAASADIPVSRAELPAASAEIPAAGKDLHVSRAELPAAREDLPAASEERAVRGRAETDDRSPGDFERGRRNSGAVELSSRGRLRNAGAVELSSRDGARHDAGSLRYFFLRLQSSATSRLEKLGLSADAAAVAAAMTTGSRTTSLPGSSPPEALLPGGSPSEASPSETSAPEASSPETSSATGPFALRAGFSAEPSKTSPPEKPGLSADAAAVAAAMTTGSRTTPPPDASLPEISASPGTSRTTLPTETSAPGPLRTTSLPETSASPDAPRAGFSAELRRAYSRTGASHLLAVSGLHVGIIFLIINGLLYFLPLVRGGRAIKSLLAVAAIWGYAAMTGMSASVMRAAVMFTGAQLAVALGAARSAANVLCGAAVLLLAMSPGLIFDVSFQLSFLAVAGIMCWYSTIYRAVRSRWRLLNFLWSTLIVGFSASVATMPLVSHIFGVISPLGVLLNPILIATAWIVVAFSAIWILVPWSGWAPLFRWLIDGAAGVQNAVIQRVSEIPGVAVELRLSAAAVCAIYAALIMLSLALSSRKRKGGSLR